MKKFKIKSRTTIIIIILIILIISASVFLGFKIYNDMFNQTVEESEQIEEKEEVLTAIIEEEQIEIYSGIDRSIAVMLDNNEDSWPQAGLNDAYLVYEIIVEGGETRLMALFKGVDLDLVGSVRSSRHYFIDYVMENDAIYAHFGQSPQAESDLELYSINNINGLYEDGTTYWRVSDKYAPHNAVTSIANLLESAEDKGYSILSDEESILNYTTKEVINEEGITTNSVTIPYSTLQTVEYIYDSTNMVYERYARGEEQVDWTTEETVTIKNIIITLCENYTLTGEESTGRQGLYNIGTFDGYYITNGTAIKITCTKSSRASQTIYKDLDGNEIEVNDGNTFIQIVSPDADITFE